ncbi:outer membrane protein assembly factor [Lysobacter pythonis]|uniref:Translocation and assembly module subunit TamA n=1 Tax=Solilutibacter pythonis TaxID=2483112 RepID=A0A3M2HVW1_9GAMM|nr:outer membrane protein assembly factor [Lysobacter pythonis]
MLCLALPATAHAAKIARVEVRGLDEAMTENVRVALSLKDALDKKLTTRRLEYLMEVANDEAREALEPFGYYTPTIRIGRGGSDDALVITLDIDKGEPVRVRNENVRIEGDAANDRYMKSEIDAFQPKPGEILNHPQYETAKARITRRLAERGYFDADFTVRRVEVTRADRTADIDLGWNSGERYDMGPITFLQTPEQIINPGVLRKLVYWKEGDYYHQGRLDRLRKSLVSLDYFASIDISAEPEKAEDYLVPVTVRLTPAKRSIYNFGVSYGTYSGAGFTAGLERRYLNRRGHKALAQLDFARFRKILTLQYRVPAFHWLDGWYTASLQAADEATDYIYTQRLELVGSRSGEINRYLTASVSLHALRERWLYAHEYLQNLDSEPPYHYASYTYPSLRAEYIDADDRMFPRRGLGGTLMLRGGPGIGRSASAFGQLHASARWYRGLGERNRLIARGELGHTFAGKDADLPPSLRFFAGGDRSIRGYAWREVGPRVSSLRTDGKRYALGARNVATASLEFERYFTPTLGAALFVDSGSAFNQKPEWRTGVGIGARWKSPVGPVRIDVARGLDQPDSSYQLYLSLGADL